MQDISDEYLEECKRLADQGLTGREIRRRLHDEPDGNNGQRWLKSRLDEYERRTHMKEPVILNGVIYGYAKRGTVNLDADGAIKQQWLKFDNTKGNPTELVDAIRASFDAYDGRARRIEPPFFANQDLCTLYPLADVHLGLYAWKKETGADYDLAIALDTVRTKFAELVAMSPPAATAVVLGLGDFFHADDHDSRTRKSHAVLDTDTRFAKVAKAGVDLWIWAVEHALTKHDKVHVRILKGNHDPNAWLYLYVALSAFFRDNPRVEFEDAAEAFWWFRFGKVFLGAHHGDGIKMGDYPGIMAARRPEDWGASSFRYFWIGHIHHKELLEKHGVVVESLQSPAARDAWHSDNGYTSGRSMMAITYHRDTGEDFRVSRPIGITV